MATLLQITASCEKPVFLFFVSVFIFLKHGLIKHV